MCVHMCGGTCVSTVLHVYMVVRSLCHIFFDLFLSLYWSHVFLLTLDHFNLASPSRQLTLKFSALCAGIIGRLTCPTDVCVYSGNPNIGLEACNTHWVISLLHQVIVLEIILYICHSLTYSKECNSSIILWRMKTKWQELTCLLYVCGPHWYTGQLVGIQTLTKLRAHNLCHKSCSVTCPW